MYWNILVWLRLEIPDSFLHQISEILKIDDLVTGGTINLQLTLNLHFLTCLRILEFMASCSLSDLSPSLQTRSGNAMNDKW